MGVACGRAITDFIHTHSELTQDGPNQLNDKLMVFLDAAGGQIIVTLPAVLISIHFPWR